MEIPRVTSGSLRVFEDLMLSCNTLFRKLKRYLFVTLYNYAKIVFLLTNSS